MSGQERTGTVVGIKYTSVGSTDNGKYQSKLDRTTLILSAQDREEIMKAIDSVNGESVMLSIYTGVKQGKQYPETFIVVDEPKKPDAASTPKRSFQRKSYNTSNKQVS